MMMIKQARASDAVWRANKPKKRKKAKKIITNPKTKTQKNDEREKKNQPPTQ